LTAGVDVDVLNANGLLAAALELVEEIDMRG
jgi:hypothetical protein